MPRPASQRYDGYRRNSSNSADSNAVNVCSSNMDQLVVLGIRISAQCTVEETNRAPYDDLLQAESSSTPHASGALLSRVRHISANGGGAMADAFQAATVQVNNYGPPSSFKDPDMKSGGGYTARRRPRSAEFGAKAKEAMLGFGRAARELPRGLYGLRNPSKTDVTEGSDALGVQSPMDRFASSAPPETPSTPLVRSILRVRRVYRLRPRSSSGARQWPILVGCRTEVRSAHSDGSDSGWERLRSSSPVEYVNDTEPQKGETGHGRAGVFHAPSYDQNGDQHSDVETSQDTAYSSNNMSKGNDDDQSLLKVTSPTESFMERAGQQRLLRGWRNEVVIRIRFSGGTEALDADVLASTEMPSSPLLSRAMPPLGPRGLRASSNATTSSLLHSQPSDSEIIFLSCDSSKKLLHAVESTQLEHGRLSGPLATQASAKLEGITWVNVGHTSTLGTSTPTEFEWTWHDVSAGGHARPPTMSRFAKCASAIVTIDGSSGKLRLSTLFQFVIDRSTMNLSDKGNAISRGDGEHLSARGLQTYKGGLKETPFPSQTDAIGLGVQCPDARAERRSASNAPRGLSVHEDVDSHTSASTTCQDNHTPSLTDPSLDASRGHLKDIDHVEMSLQDVESDSPIFRTTIQGLERRTTSLKRAAKAVVRAAEALVGSFDALEGYDGQLDHSLEDLAVFMPATFQGMSSTVLQKAREEEREHRQQTRARLVAHVVTPIRALTDVCREVLVQLKCFEAESKVYYSATQKWLSSGTRGIGAGNVGDVSADDSDVYSPDAIRYDKSFAKADKLDDEQRLRQARFDLARFDVYRAVCQLHAGEVELAIASHLTAISRWYCQGDEGALAEVHAFDMIAEVELGRVKFDAEVAEARCQELHGKIAEQLLLNREIDSHTFTALHDGPDTIQSYPNGKATRQKLKSLLSVLGGRAAPPHGAAPLLTQKQGRAPHSCPIPPVEAFESGLTYDEAASENRTSDDDGRPARTNGKPQTRVRTVSLNKEALDAERHRLSVTVTDAGRAIVRGVGSAADTTQDTAVAGAPSVASAVRPMPIPIQAPRDSSVPLRKKEGILWVMAKPISVTGTSDVPKAAVRANNWRECWVVLSGSGHLGEYAHWKDSKAMTLEPAQPLIDLRFATVREARGLERRFSFEVVTRESRRFFQASNEEEFRCWMTAISFAIASLLDGTSSVRQVEKVVRHSVAAYGVLTDSQSPEKEFGMRRVFDASAATAGIGIHKAFSQSLTDLSSGAGGRLFQRAMVAAGREEGTGTRKRDSKTIHTPRGHLLTLSEGSGVSAGTAPVARGDDGNDTATDADGLPTSPLLNKHARGISNTTPLSGYLAGARRKDVDSESTGMRLSASASGGAYASRSSLNIDTDYDRRIEALVNSNYGSISTSMLSSSSSGVSSGILTRSRSTHRTSMPASSHIPASYSQTSDDDYKEASPSKSSNAREILAIASRPENRECADCRKPNPRWASWCLNGEACCVFICITCSGIHRSMGVGVSKVRSVDLDDWTGEQLQAARRWGNTRVNAVYEAKKPRELTVASIGDTRTKAFWTTKYIERAWFGDSSATFGVAEVDVLDDDQSDRTSCARRPHRLDLPYNNVLSSPRAVSALQDSHAHNRQHESAVPILIAKSASAAIYNH